ncbi:MAG: hypothetical protein A3B44_03390 [Candidatus Levybacteria bacterium RIFCSPLOWO2_01_FULL_38_21]|nr:MAG: hypothetical protein A3B44_03390 [Candidatus Levybacteria bacterium RIFCSPLOWO2_01_FULL_38_21]
MKSFGSRDLENFVKKFNFTFHSISSSHHAKYYPPKSRISTDPSRPFFQFQLGRKTYDPHSASRYISQLKKLGLTKEEIEKNI